MSDPTQAATTTAALIALVSDTANQVRCELAAVDPAHAAANLAILRNVLRRQVAFVEAMMQDRTTYPTTEG